MCGFGVQEEKDQKNVVKKIHTIGCINRLQQYFESNLFTVGIVALCVAVTQLGGKNHYFFSFISTFSQLKFIYSEKATKFCEIFPLLLTNKFVFFASNYSFEH